MNSSLSLIFVAALLVVLPTAHGFGQSASAPGTTTSSASVTFPAVSTNTLPLPPIDQLTSGVPDLPPALAADILGTTSLELAPISVAPMSLPPLDLSPLDTSSVLSLDQPLTTGIANLDTDLAAPTSVALSIERILPLESPLTNLALTDLAEFERYIANKTPFVETIDLNAVVVRAVCRNLDIRLTDIDHLISNDEYVAQQGIFDLRISGMSQVTRSQTASGSQSSGFDFSGLGIDSGTDTSGDVDTGTTNDGTGTDGTDTGGSTGSVGSFGSGGSGDRKSFQNSVTVGQLLPTGGLVELLFDNTKTETNSGPAQAVTRAGLRATQPLLRNAGPLVTQSRIILAGFDTRLTASRFRQQVMQQVARAIELYYDLIFAVSNLEVLRISLAQAEELLRVNRAKYEAGVLPELDVLQAQADVATRQQAVIEALQQIEAASDLLKTQLAAIDDPNFVSLRPADDPRVPEYPVSERVFLDEAVAFRPEMEQVCYEIEKQGINLRVSWNQTLPQVDLMGSYIPTGAGQTRLGSIEEAARTRTEDWSFGVQFNYPLQNREARYRFHQEEKRLDQQYVRLQQTRNNVILDVRNAARAVETNRASIGVGRTAVEFNRAKVQAALERQAVGLATSTDVLEFQRDLAEARIRLLESVIEYNQAIVALELAKGTLLDSLGILVCDGEIYKGPNRPKKALGLSD